MFKINDCVVYRTNGVCRITDIKKEQFGSETKEYYVLTPVFGNTSTVYVPLDSKELTDKMKQIIPAQEVHGIIDRALHCPTKWIENDRQRSKEYSAILEKGDAVELFSLVGILIHHKEELEAAGRKFRVTDKRIMEAAQKILYEEFAISLNIDIENVSSYIRKELNDKEE